MDIDMKKGHHLINIAIILIWVGMMTTLVKRYYFPPSKNVSIPDETFIPSPDFLSGGDREEWMGIYYKGQKIGYSTRVLKKLEDGYRISENTFLSINLLHTTRETYIKSTAFLKDDFTLDSFNFSLSSENVDFYVKGKMEGKILKLKLKTGHNIREDSIKLEKIPHLSVNLPLYLAQKGLRRGDSFLWPFFDPSTLSEGNILVEVMGEEPVMINDEVIDAYKIKETYNGLTFFSWIGRDGTVFREESPLGFIMLREKQKQATALEKGKIPAIDFIASTAIKANVDLQNPEQLDYLKLRIGGIKLEDYHLDGGRQRLRGDILEITKEDLRTMEDLPIDGLTSHLSEEEKEWQKYVRPTLLIQSDHPDIIALAKDIIGDEKKALDAVKSICHWVHDNLEKRMTVSIPSALEVLSTKVGDCNEHTVLFTALCRALKIPAEMNAGLLYHEKRFYYHAWSEVYVGRWISVDPLMNQVPADATHVRLIRGDLMEQAKILNLIGRLSIDILDYR